jgi:hypothetical protein
VTKRVEVDFANAIASTSVGFGFDAASHIANVEVPITLYRCFEPGGEGLNLRNP